MIEIKEEPINPKIWYQEWRKKKLNSWKEWNAYNSKKDANGVNTSRPENRRKNILTYTP